MQQRSKIKTVSENGGGGLGRTVEGGWGEQWRKRGWGYARKLRLRTPTSDASPLALGSVSGDVDGNSCLDTFLMSYYVSKMYFLINTPKALFTYYSTVILVHRWGRNKVRDTDAMATTEQKDPCQLIHFPSRLQHIMKHAKV